MSKKILRINIYNNNLPNGINGPEDELNEIQRRTLESALLGPDEYPIIYKDHQITDEEFEDALDVILTHAMQRQLHTVTVDLDIKSKIIEERNKPLKISIQELSEMFGGREIIIVGSKSETGCTDDKNDNPIGCGIDGK